MTEIKITPEELSEYSKYRLDRIYRFPDLLSEYQKYVKDLNKKKRYLGFAPTLDKSLGGIRPGQLLSIITRTNVGKTTMMLNTIRIEAERLNRIGDKSIIIAYSLEEPEEGLFERTVQMEQDVNSYDIENKFQFPKSENYEFIEKIRKLINEKYSNVYMVVCRLKSSELLPYCSLIADKLHRGNSRIGLVLVDYVGLLKNNFANEYSRITQSMIDLSELSLALRVPVINFSQTGRANIKDKKSELDLYSGKGSGEVENSSKILITIEEVPSKKLGRFDPHLIKDIEAQRKNLLYAKIKKKKQGKYSQCYLVLDRTSLVITEYNKSIKTEEEQPEALF